LRARGNYGRQNQKKRAGNNYQGGKPAAVILDIDVYQEMLERLEDVEDLKMLAEMRQKPLKFRNLENFLVEFPSWSL
jgi:hypothetical protein